MGDDAQLKLLWHRLMWYKQYQAFDVFKAKLNFIGLVILPLIPTDSLNTTHLMRIGSIWSMGRITRTLGDKAAYRIANLARSMNDNSFFTYSSKLLSATDDGFKVIMARMRAREQAIRKILSEQPGTRITPEARSKVEDEFYSKLLDSEGNIDPSSDTYLKSIIEENTLTTELSGFAAGLDAAFNKAPALKPFYLFARTGVNSIALGMKNTPLLNLALDKQRYLSAALDGNGLAKVQKYGINSLDELRNEKALMLGCNCYCCCLHGYPEIPQR